MPRWELMTSTEIGDAVTRGMDFAILPVGATEQHGPHLATGCDTISAEMLADAAAARTGVLVLPSIAYGCSLGHTERWPGTFSLHPQTMQQMVVEIGRWAAQSGIRRMLLLSGHATNGPVLGSAILQLRYELPECRYAPMGLWEISPRVRDFYLRDGEDIHANRGETSILLHLRPEMVRMEHAFDVPDVTPGRVFSYPMPATTPTGVVGAPRLSTAEDGKMMVDAIVDDLVAWLEKALDEKWPTVPSGPGQQS